MSGNNTMKVLLIVFLLVPTLIGSLIASIITYFIFSGATSLQKKTGTPVTVFPLIVPFLISLIIFIGSIVSIILVSNM